MMSPRFPLKLPVLRSVNMLAVKPADRATLTNLTHAQGRKTRSVDKFYATGALKAEMVASYPNALLGQRRAAPVENLVNLRANDRGLTVNARFAPTARESRRQSCDTASQCGF